MSQTQQADDTNSDGITIKPEDFEGIEIEGAASSNETMTSPEVVSGIEITPPESTTGDLPVIHE